MQPIGRDGNCGGLCCVLLGQSRGGRATHLPQAETWRQAGSEAAKPRSDWRPAGKSTRVNVECVRHDGELTVARKLLYDPVLRRRPRVQSQLRSVIEVYLGVGFVP